MKNQNEMTLEEKNRANKCCFFSLVLFLLPGIVFIWMIVFEALFEHVPNISDIGEAIFGLILSFSGSMYIAAVALMICVRIRYPKSKFGKVLMILYIVATLLLIACCIVLLYMCYQCLQDCGGMG